jgi:hypothetical protein
MAPERRRAVAPALGVDVWMWWFILAAWAGEMVPALAAARTLEPGAVLAPRDLLEGTIDPSGLTFVPLGQRDEVVGRVVRERILAGELIRPERLSQGETTVPRGFRALVVAGSVAEVAVGGRVDLVDRVRECRFAELVQVIGVQDAAGQSVPPGQTGGAAVVVALSPEQGQRAAAVRAGGGLTAVQRTSTGSTGWRACD